MNVPRADRYGPYEVIARLSAGGMGEVYRARDPRLNREVAIKVLPEALATDPDRRRRFLHEARTAGSLNHPNILSVHDVELDAERPYLVTELVEGTTLRQDIERRPMPIRRVVDLAAQVASGLQAAHSAGIVHRDLKPENIMVSRDGRAKILDFGLAKTMGEASADTLAQTQTASGIVMGTAPYMSPQQARGEAVDYRTDQFSLGLVLYEMVTGVHPFRRESSVQTMSAIIAEELRPIAEVNGLVPLQLRWIIERCLAKDPAGRYASTVDLARDLQVLHLRFAEAASDLVARPAKVRRWRWLPLAGLALVFAGATWLAVAPGADVVATHRFSPLVTDAPFQSAPAWSPDGQSIAFVSQVDGVLQIFTRSVSVSSPRAQLTRSLFDSTDPFWSADGSRVFFQSQANDTQGLWAISTAGGEPQLIRANAARAHIGSDGRRIAFLQQSESDRYSYELMAADTLDGPARRIDFGERVPSLSDAWMRFSPDGRRLLVWYAYTFADNAFYAAGEVPFRVIDWPNGEPQRVLPSLFAQANLAAVGAFDWMPDGRHVVIAIGDPRSATKRLWMADIDADRVEPLTMTPAAESFPSVAPDGSRLAFTSEAVDFDLVAVPLDGGPPRALLATSRNEYDPSWAPDQSQFVFVTDRSGTLEVWLRSANGLFERPLVTDQLFPGSETRAIGSTAFSPDGSRVAFQRLGRSGGYRIFIASTAAATPPTEFRPGGPSFHDAPTWSPDGSWLAAIVGLPGGEAHLVKARVGGSSDLVTLSRDVLPFSRPEWSPDGRSIVFASSDGLALIGADGGTPRIVSDHVWIAQTWSADSRTILGLREAAVDRHFMLASIDVGTGRERVLNPDLGVIPPANQPIRGLTRLGTEAVVTSIARARSDIFMLEGFRAARGLMARIREVVWNW